MIGAKKIKKITALTLALGLTLTGCGSAAGAAGNAGSPASQAEGTAVSGPITVVEYPETPRMPDYESYENDPENYQLAFDKWVAAREERESFYEGNARALNAFNAATVPVFLSGEGENKVYSPINVFFALAMLSRVCEGDTKQEILSLLGLPEEELAGRIRALWNANTVGDETVTSQLANSLWISNAYPYNEETLQNLAKEFYAESYSGAMGSPEYNAQLQKWLNDHTGNLLEEAAGDVEMNADTILALASAIYYKASWSQEFSGSATETFHSLSGDEECEMMQRTEQQGYYFGEGYVLTEVDIRESGSLRILIPDEGTAVSEVLSNPAAMEKLLSADIEDWSYGSVNFKLPKFDVTSTTDLIGGLQSLGVLSAFNPEASDFSPLTPSGDPIYVSSATHSARVVTDENGVLAAAFTVMMVDKAVAFMPEDPVEITADRPFLFAITASDGSVLFTGVVNHPAE